MTAAAPEPPAQPAPLFSPEAVDSAVEALMEVPDTQYRQMAEAVLTAPGVRRDLLAWKDGYRSIVDYADGRANRLAAALEAAERSRDLLAEAHRRRLCGNWKPGHTYSTCCDHWGCHNAWSALVEAGVETAEGHYRSPVRGGLSGTGEPGEQIESSSVNEPG